MGTVLAVSAICALSISGTGSAALAAGELAGASASGNFAGYGYTHGMVPVMNEVGGASIHDRDMMRYDKNRRRGESDYYQYEQKDTEPEVLLLQILLLRKQVYRIL